MASAIYLSDSAMRMDRDITTACTMHSEDPFSDDYALDEDAERGDYETSAIKEWQVWAGSQERTIAVPIIDLLPHLEAWSSAWSNTTPSTPSSPTQEALSAPLQWTDADLMYLLSCLLSDLLLTNRLVFAPPLEDLHAHPGPYHVRLYQKLAGPAPTTESFSKYAPIGTGRPQNQILLAESGKKCNSPQQARLSLALNLLLENEAFATCMLDKYNVLAALYNSSTSTLISLQRGMIEMLGVSDREWHGRYEQLSGHVDGSCGLEARMEVFLLGVGRMETEEWMSTVELAAETEDKDRKVWAQVHGDAATFLDRVIGEMY